MKKGEFIKKLLDALESEDTNVDETTPLKQIKGYDSLGVLSIIAMVDKHFGVKIAGKEVVSLNTIQDLIDKIGRNKIDG